MRLIGILLILGCLLVAVIAVGDRRWVFAILSSVCVALGLCVAVLGDKGINRRKSEAAAKRKEAALSFNASEFCVGLRWARAIFFMSLMSLLGGFAVLTAVTFFLQSKFLNALGLFVLGAILSTSALSFLMTIYVFLRDKCLVRMDAGGLALWGRSPIGWKTIEGIDLKEVEVKSQKQYHLVLAINSEYFLAHPLSKILTGLHWSAPRPTLSLRTLAVPCALLNVNPELLVQAAKVIADHFGSRRVKDWNHYIPIGEAIANRDRLADIERTNRDVDRLLSRLRGLDTKTHSGSQEMLEIDRKLTRTLQSNAELNDANLKAFELHANRTKARLTRIRWAFVLLFLFALSSIVVKIVSALNR